MFNPELGTIIGGKYRLLRRLGEGGMGTVYEAENTLTLKRAAVKWLHPEYAAHASGKQRIVHEARATCRIQHDNVVDVYDVVEEELAVFLVMELLQGEPLARWLERPGRPMHTLIQIVLAAMRGVAAAHAVGVVHRDIKPENIFLAREAGYADLVPKVIDFGISKVHERDGGNSTRSGITMGTPKYVSYEQLLGSRDVDARTDVYSFGVILYESLSGRPPYDEAQTFAEQAVRFATQTPPALCSLRPEIPAPLASLVERTIAKEREHRVPTMDAFIQALEPFALAASFTAPLLARPVASGGRQDNELDAAAVGATFSHAPSSGHVRASDANPREEPRTATIRVSVPATPRGQRVLHVAVGLLLLLLVAMLSRRGDGEVNERSRAEPSTVDAGGSAGLAGQQPAGEESAEEQQLPGSALAYDAARPQMEVHAPGAETPRVRRHDARNARKDVDASLQQNELSSAPTAPKAEAEGTQSPPVHRAGVLNRSEF